MKKQGVIDLFYKNFTPKILVDGIFSATNDDLKYPKSTLFMDLCKDFGQESWFKNGWEFDIETRLTSLKKDAVIDILMKIRAFQEMK